MSDERCRDGWSDGGVPSNSRIGWRGVVDRLRALRATIKARLEKRDAILLVPECAAIGCFIALASLSLWMPLAQERMDAERAAVDGTSNLARAFEENTDRIISGIDQILLSARADFQENEANFNIRAWAAKRARPDRFAFFIGRVDERGFTRETTFSPAPPPIDISDREHFKFHLDPARDELYIGTPLVGRATGKAAVQFTRKVFHANGGFAGIVQISLDVNELSKYYDTLQIGNGYVMLVGDDAVIRARGPMPTTLIGTKLNNPMMLERLNSGSEGTFRSTAPSEGIARIVSYRRLKNYPLIVMIGFDEAHVFQHYMESRRNAVVTAVIVLAMGLLLGGFWIDQRRNSLRSRRALRVTIDSINQGIVMIDAEGRVPVVNQRALEILDLAPTALEGEAGPSRLRALHLTTTNTQLADLDRLQLPLGRIDDITPGIPGDGAVFEARHASGKIIEVQSNHIPSGGVVLTYTDVTERRLTEARIHHLAHHDGLTGLPNRILLNERLNEAVNRAIRERSAFAVLCLDLDGFKGVNDTMGHDAGDLLLIRVADRLRAMIRPTDTVARTGGDEFAIVQSDIGQPESAESLAHRLIASFAEPVVIDGYQLTVGTSVGIAIYPANGTDGRTLLSNADTALYRAKGDGRGTFRFFEPWMDSSLQERRAIEDDLRRALERGQLDVHFQPQFTCDTLEVVGFEALVRWNDRTRGMVPPGVFIPIAEECGLIGRIGRFVLEEACAQAVAWRPQCRVAVNLSPVQFRDPGLPQIVAETLERTGLQPELLELEVTEGVLIGDEQLALGMLRALKEQGVRISLDDFGTGFSSLSYLRRFPFDKIKIDRSFVQGQQTDPGTQAIMEAVLAMSARLNLEVIAEGVETEEQLAMIRRQGCGEVQGYLLGRPMPRADIPRFLSSRRSVPLRGKKPAGSNVLEMVAGRD